MSKILRGCTACTCTYYESEPGESGCPNCGEEEIDEEYYFSDEQPYNPGNDS